MPSSQGSRQTSYPSLNVAHGMSQRQNGFARLAKSCSIVSPRQTCTLASTGAVFNDSKRSHNASNALDTATLQVNVSRLYNPVHIALERGT